MKNSSNKARANINKIIFRQIKRSLLFKYKLIIISKANQIDWRKEVITFLKINWSEVKKTLRTKPKSEKVPIKHKKALV